MVANYLRRYSKSFEAARVEYRSWLATDRQRKDFRAAVLPRMQQQAKSSLEHESGNTAEPGEAFPFYFAQATSQREKLRRNPQERLIARLTKVLAQQPPVEHLQGWYAVTLEGHRTFVDAIYANIIAEQWYLAMEEAINHLPDLACTLATMPLLFEPPRSRPWLCTEK